MKKATSFLLVGTAGAIIYVLWPKNSQPVNAVPTQTDLASATIPSFDSSEPVSIDIQPSASQPAPQTISDSFTERLAALHSKLRRWWESQTHNPDDEEGRKQLLTEMLGMVSDENVVDVVKSLSTEELNTPFGIGTLHHWMRVDCAAATGWLAARPDSTKEQILAVAEDWTANPDGLQQYLDQLPQSTWRQNFLEQAGSAALSTDPSEAVKLAKKMDSGDTQINLLRAAACKWISADPNAALDWITSVDDQSLREQLIASAAQSYALTDPSLSMAWLTSQVKSDPIIKDASCNILETWVSSDPASAATWVSGISDGAFKTAASKIVFKRWFQIDPDAANAWADSLQAN